MKKYKKLKEGSKEEEVLDKKEGVKRKRKAKRSAGAPSGAKSPFGTIKTDKRDNAGQRFNKMPTQGVRLTGATMLKKATGKLKAAYRG